MKAPFLLVLCWMIVNVCGVSSQASELTQKTDEDLAILASEPDPSRQLDILSILAMRYRPPGEIVIRSRVLPEEAHPAGTAVSSVITSNVFQIAKQDQDEAVRVAAVDLMTVLLSRTNILELMGEFLDDRELTIRLRACTAMIDYAKEQGATVVPKVSESLATCLDSSNDVGSLCVALKSVGELGTGASNCAPQVISLTKHPVGRVRKAARLTLRAIQPASQ